jgi:hypothetical protein
MLIDLIDYAIDNREEILSSLRGSEELFSKARDEWYDFKPTPRNVRLVGIDSSYNFFPYLGFYLFAVDAISIDATSQLIDKPRVKVGIGKFEVEEEHFIHDPRSELQSICLDFEYELALKSSKVSDIVMVDGSVLARYYDRRERRSKPFYEHAKGLMEVENIVFIAKTSTSNTVLNGNMGDIYYFDKASSTSGFSRPIYDRSGVTVFYARLSSFSPCLRFEVPGKISEEEVKDVLCRVSVNSVNGYPYELLLAHESCKVEEKTIEDIAYTLGLFLETGGREVVGE